MPGYDLDEGDLRNISDKYLCSSCNKLLRDPVQTKCGHFYCSSCVDDFRESDRTLWCKVDGTWLAENEIFPDRCVKREVDHLIVSCPQKPCKWRGQLKNLQEHLWACVYILIPCMFGCGTMLRPSDTGAHLEECKAGGGANTEARKESSWSFLSSLSSFSDLSSLRNSDGGCFFECIGCKIPKTLTVKQLREHNMRSIKHHVTLLLDYILKQEAQLQNILTQKLQTLSTQVSEQAAKITHLENVTRGMWGVDVEAVLRRLINAENMNANYDVLMAELNTAIEDLRKKVAQSEKQQENQLRMINELRGSPGPRNSASALSVDEQFQLLSLSSFDGVLLWKITDVQRKRNEAVANRTVSISSPPFYTDRYGYKMCLRLYLNGDGLGRGQYLSLFFVVMRGEYDALLRWPFRNKITMMLLDQNHVEHVIDAFEPDPSSSSFQRPGTAMNIASGCPMFCPLADLDKFAYVKDDTMFIKVIVETKDSF